LERALDPSRRIRLVTAPEGAGSARAAALGSILAAYDVEVRVERGHPSAEAAVEALLAAGGRLSSEEGVVGALILLDPLVGLGALAEEARAQGLPVLDLDGVEAEAIPAAVSTFLDPRLRALEPPAPADELGVLPEVRRLSHLLLSKSLRPPVAIGLFGGWGSGRSYFLSRLCDEVHRLADQPDDRRLHRVCVIRVNAWHFVDNNLWASLATQIFSQLDAWVRRAQHPPLHLLRQREAEAVSVQRRRLFVAEEALAAAIAEETAQREASLQQAAAERERMATLGALADADLRAALASPALVSERAALNEALKRIGAAPFSEEAFGLLALEGGLGRGLRGPIPLLQVMGRTLFAMDALKFGLIGLLFALIGLSVAPEKLEWLSLDAETLVLPQLFVAAGAFLRHLMTAYDQITKAAAVAGAAESLATQARDAVLSRREAERAARLRAESSRVEVARQAAAEAQAAVREAQARLDALAPEQRLLRLSSLAGGEEGPYRRQEGLIAELRRDLSSLEQILREDPENLDRVILTIDDLDRCPADRVVAALEAIHLLLAYELFVVVVAVDRRFLERCLRSPGPGRAAVTDRAEAIDWIEKIFQLPFAVGGLQPIGLAHILRTIAPPGAPAPAPIVRCPADDGIESTEHFTMGEAEHAFSLGLADLIGSPRAGRRFVNTYRLLRAAVPDCERPAFLSGEHRVLLLLLAASVGAPRPTAGLLRRLALGDTPEAAVAALRGADPHSHALATALAAHLPDCAAAPQVWMTQATRLARYTFWGTDED
jgi:hypothetical protein